MKLSKDDVKVIVLGVTAIATLAAEIVSACKAHKELKKIRLENEFKQMEEDNAKLKKIADDLENLCYDIKFSNIIAEEY